MSIAAFKKVTLLGLSQEKNELLTKLQSLGCLHLIAINPKSKSKLTSTSTTALDEIKASLRYLKEAPEQGSPRLFWKEATPTQVVQEILANQRAFRKAIDRHDFLTTRIRDLREWGHFVLPSQHALAGIKLWFYKLPLTKLSMFTKEQAIQEVYRNQRYIFIVLCAEEEPGDETLSTYRVHTGAICLNALFEELDELNEQIEDLIDKRRSLTRFCYLLAKEVAQFADQSELKKATEKTQDYEAFFLVQGWIPEQQLAGLEDFCTQQRLGLTIEEPLADELPPTLLEAPNWLHGGRELVNFYQTPGYHSLDPSIMVFFSFALFFAMILADAGYGIMIALFTFFTWKRLDKFPFSYWLKPLLVVISLFSIIYGALLGSYWGVAPKKGTFLASLYLIDIHNFNAMMSLVIVIGCLHICLGCGMRAWFAKEWNTKLQAIGFISLIISVLIFSFALMQKIALLKESAIVLFIISSFLIMFFASSEPVRGFKSLLQRIIQGLGAFAELPSLFGDILSYLRLFALGLAGASLAITFNSMAHHITQISWVLAALVLFLGQTLNFALCLMGAVIHGLRLNYIEFFKWSVKEEGYGYQPLKKQEITHE